MTDIHVQDSPDRSRFEILVDGELGGFADYRVRDGRTIITHSEIDRSRRGQGLGGKLAEQTLNQLRDRGARVVTVCPFFAEYVAGRHDWDAILADEPAGGTS